MLLNEPPWNLNEAITYGANAVSEHKLFGRINLSEAHQRYYNLFIRA